MSNKRMQLDAGQIVFEEGDPPTSAYLVESGRIEILTVKDGVPMVLSVLGPGDLLGEMAVIDDAPRTATARALTDAVLIEVDRAQNCRQLALGAPSGDVRGDLACAMELLDPLPLGRCVLREDGLGDIFLGDRPVEVREDRALQGRAPRLSPPRSPRPRS